MPTHFYRYFIVISDGPKPRREGQRLQGHRSRRLRPSPEAGHGVHLRRIARLLGFANGKNCKIIMYIAADGDQIIRHHSYIVAIVCWFI